MFLPAYFLAVPWRLPFIKEFLITGLSTVIGYTSLCGLFGRKLKILITDKRHISKEYSSDKIRNGYDCVSSISQMIHNGRQDALSPCSRSNNNDGESDNFSAVSEDLL